MKLSAKSIARLARPQITNERELRRFVIRIAAIAIVCALALDAAQQLVFFISWPAVLRSWVITVVVAAVISIPIAYVLGRAQLELSEARNALEELSRIDPLTGLPNRRWLLAASETASESAMVLVLADIDNFKRVNDVRGHRVGDAVVRHVGTLMQNALGDLGIVGRFGGDEFALVAPRPDTSLLVKQLVYFRDLVGRSPLLVDGLAVQVSISAGVAIRDQGETFNQLYSEADEALYAAKAAGKNQVGFSRGLEERFGQIASLSEGRPLNVA